MCVGSINTPKYTNCNCPFFSYSEFNLARGSEKRRKLQGLVSNKTMSHWGGLVSLPNPTLFIMCVNVQGQSVAVCDFKVVCL